MSTEQRVVGLGAGGHAKVVIDAIRLLSTFSIVALLDQNHDLWGTTLLGVPIVGGDDQLERLCVEGVAGFFVGAGMVKSSKTRARLFARGLALGLGPVSVVHPSAVVSAHAMLGQGVTVLAAAVVNAGARVGANVIINTGAIVEHDCTIADHAHIATGARVSGGVTIGAGAHIGVGASVRQGIQIGDGAIVGAGAAVVKNVPAGAIVVGVPARRLSEGP